MLQAIFQQQLSTGTHSAESIKKMYIEFCYKPPLVQRMTNVYLIPIDKQPLVDGVAKCSVSKPYSAIVQEKGIMVVGWIGIGKSTLINRMVNHILGVKHEENFRFKLVAENEIQNGTKSISVYSLHRSTLPFSLTIIDTPGFEQDRQTLYLIKNLFKSNAVTRLDAVAVVVNYSSVRFPESYTAIFTEIFAKDVQNNVFIFMTFCDEDYDSDDDNEASNAPVLQAMRAIKFPFTSAFRVNWYKIFDEKRNILSDMFWKMSEHSFNVFFDTLESVEPISIALTKEVLEEKEKATEKLWELQFKIQVYINQMHILKKASKIFKDDETGVIQAYSGILKIFIQMRNCLDFVNKNQFIRQNQISFESCYHKLVQNVMVKGEDGHKILKCFHKLEQLKITDYNLQAFDNATKAKQINQAMQFLED